MSVSSESIEIAVDGQSISGTILTPGAKIPGILFVHGWGGSQQRDLARAKNITGLGCVCLTFDLRGHERTHEMRSKVSREQSLADLLAAYDRLVSHPAVDSDAIAVIGSSYGGYLATILSSMRPVKWLALRVPALYWDADWEMPKQELDRDKLAHYRRSAVTAADNRALAACKEFHGDVLLIESEQDDYVPHATLMSYRSAFEQAHSLTYRLVDGADHALSSDLSQSMYSSMLTNWISEMVIGARLVDYPHHSAKYS
ncbi:Dipeptidyl aminopeptidase/acylaminoacyl-peptidase-like protein [Pseudomonas savastanoi pv. glycinea]|uniref:alpha/beta hydrolase family protein n=1 Tax=Pseudomonas quasicaspiana TaxID=2829821 RepID=UPI000EFEAA22|nr:alpha/beta fold hydrolase [Pseudomonas quasicaspiana]MCD5974055.1 alpha/beta fold hydrolase [Pseudomonas quasicaspiana]MCD5980380.1 alpha/beta fold hydrolase [Pseudomonas quasicaspiana]MCQ3030667.1 alpha/beta fold hydrolase [Pseudomonas syringae]RMR05275.1 Dipeptidyl aminopeptidase/acylaminoacyl-peptidase-like protein [Pseudomonas savastanoi pv. glycinea]